LVNPLEVSVTVSIGIAQGSASADADDIVKQADKALYAAKAGGRNRVEVFRREKKRRAAVAGAESVSH
jgi:diguanylate cyclase (GGDEF)-like protein